jgi:hypothetical protein
LFIKGTYWFAIYTILLSFSVWARPYVMKFLQLALTGLIFLFYARKFSHTPPSTPQEKQIFWTIVTIVLFIVLDKFLKKRFSNNKS